MRRLAPCARWAAAGIVLARLARGKDRRAPLTAAGARPPAGGVTVVIPAREEAERIGPCLAGLAGDPDVTEVVVVDDRSTDATAEVARAAGARVLAGAPLPEGWVGKPWALQQGLEAARTEWVVFLDADTRPRPGLARALVAAAVAADADLVTGGVAFECDTPGERWLHPALLISLIYRYGPITGELRSPSRALMNGQCVAVRREPMLAGGGFARAREHMTDDVALVRALVAEGWRVVFEDAADLITVDMHSSFGDLWREWGRSIAMADVTTRPWQAADLAVVWLVQALPLLRLVVRRADALDRALLAVRVLMAGGVARAYTRRDAFFWLAPLADPLAAVRLTASTLRPRREWRGRSYPRGTAGRSGT